MLRLRKFHTFVLLVVATLQLQCASKQQAHKQIEPEQKVARNQASKSLSYLHYIMGELSNSKNDSRAALEHFRYAYHFDPESETLMIRQAEQLLNLDRVDEAKIILEQLNQSKNPEVFLLTSRLATMEFDLEGAVAALGRAEEIYLEQGNSRKVRETLLTKVALLSDYRKYEEALVQIDKFLERNPNDEIAYYFKGKIYSILRENEKAKIAYREAIRIRPSFVAAIKALGLRLELEGKTQEAIDVYQMAFPTASQDKALRQKLANLHLINENYKAALEHLKQLTVLDPSDVVNQLRTALVLFKTKEYEQAEKAFEKLLLNQEVSHDRVHFYLATMYEEQEKFEKSEKHLRKINKDSDYFIEAQLQLSDLYVQRMKDNKKGVTALNEAIVLQPQSKELYLALASLHEQDNKISEAIRVLDKATKAIPGNERILFVLGSLLDRAGDYEAGINRMEEVLEINPNNAFALNHIGYVYVERKLDLNKAEDFLKKAVQLAPENGFILDSLGWLYYQKGELVKARQLLERAVEITQTEPIILEHLADTYKGLGFRQQALEIYKKVVRISVNETDKPNKKEVEAQKRLLDKIASLDSDNAN